MTSNNERRHPEKLIKVKQIFCQKSSEKKSIEKQSREEKNIPAVKIQGKN
jgi:hypothetical protein